MAFSHKEYVFSHTVTKDSKSHQPVIFKLDMSDLIVPFSGHSSVFTIDTLTVSAYKRDTAQKIPVKFAVLNDNKTRVLTNDIQKLSSKWQVDHNLNVNVAGTDSQPFKRTLSIYDEANRQSTLNTLAYMMSNSLWVADGAAEALERLRRSTINEFSVKCDVCSQLGVVSITRGDHGEVSEFYFPPCGDEPVCVPCIPSQQRQADSDYDALFRIATLVRSACCDDLNALTLLTHELGVIREYQDYDCSSFPPRHPYNGIMIPYVLMKQLTSLYQTMSDHTDIFAVVNEQTPNVKLLIESPADNIGEIHGSLGLTVIYGSTVSMMYAKLAQDMVHDEQPETVDVKQLTDDVLIRRTPLKFRFANHMEVRDWYDVYNNKKSCVVKMAIH